jgi:CHAT domain-containing protein
LPAADDEAESVRRAWPDDATIVLRGAAAAEAAVRRLAPDRALIHIATHGVVRPDDPMQSFLALSPGGAPGASGDGFLTAREVFDLRLSADLVVLSACDTGRGRIDSDGVMGFGRAFLQAGSRAVVVTLWRVADRVALHEMKAFHGELRRGTPRAEALRRAQTDTLAALRAGSIRTASGAPLAESPALWAAFAVVGDPGGP